MRPIDANAMIERLKQWDTSDTLDKALYNFTLARINEQPTIQPEPSQVATDSDTISRAKAIEALMDAMNDVGVLDAEDINTVFQMLPPAQPEHLQPWEVLTAQAVLSPPEPHWIPVTERLPDISKSVLICDIEGDIYMGHRTWYGDYYPDFWNGRIKNVTAWMPLPEPYKEVTA